MNVVWVAPYPPDALVPSSELTAGRWFHPSPWLLTLSDALLERQDVDLTIVSLSRAVPRSSKGSIAGRRFVLLRAANGGLKLATRYRIDAARVLHEVHRLRPDVVHAHGTEQEYGLVAALSKCPSVLTMQGFMAEMSRLNPGPLSYRSWTYRSLAGIEAKVLPKMGAVIAHTSYAAEYVARVAPRTPVRIIPNGVSQDFLRAGDRRRDTPPRLVFVGSVCREKGADVLLEAAAALAEDGVAFTLALVGPGSLVTVSARVNALLQGRFGQARVHRMGAVARSSVVEALSGATALVLPSLAENSPTVVMEAMAMRVPVVASRVGGIPHMISDGEDGLLVEPGDVQSLTRALRAVLCLDEGWERLSANARRRACRDYDPTRVAAEVVDLYCEVIEQWRDRKYRS